MEAIKTIYKVGYEPSSSHTMAPRKAAEQFREQTPFAGRYRITLFGSLAATGKGHLTDVSIRQALNPVPVEIIWEPETFLPAHPNGIKLEALNQEGVPEREWVTYSIGGGDLSDTGTREQTSSVYPHATMREILDECRAQGWTFWEYVREHESSDIADYLTMIWKEMQSAIHRGLEAEGVLPGPLRLPRKASSDYIRAKAFTGTMSRRAYTFAFALAVSEENAAGGKVVTAPTCGSSGVIPAVLHLLYSQYDFPETKIIRALATAGLIGNLIKTNASISGAEVGCQGEVGSACSMAAGAITQLFGGSISQIEHASSIGMEHFLGLTCDPVMGLVQIPCIERNAFGAGRALDASMYALLSDGHHLVSFDQVIQVMKHTGHDLPNIYKETSLGGLASFFGH